MSTQVPGVGMEPDRAQQGGATGQLGADLAGQAGVGERGEVDGDVGLRQELIVSRRCGGQGAELRHG